MNLIKINNAWFKIKYTHSLKCMIVLINCDCCGENQGLWMFIVCKILSILFSSLSPTTCSVMDIRRLTSSTCIRTGLKPGRITQVIQVKRVTFCASHPGQTRIIKISRSDPDLVLTALIEYFDLLAHALKVQSCYLFSHRLDS